MEILFKNAEAKRLWEKNVVKSNKNDSVNVDAVEFATEWALLMQEYAPKGKKLGKIVEQASRDCKMYDNLSGFQWTWALNQLIRYWKYGWKLHLWYIRSNIRKKIEFIRENLPPYL